MKRREKRHSPLLCCQARGRILWVLFCLTSGPNANEPCKAAKITEILNQNSCGLSRGSFELLQVTGRPSGVVQARGGGTWSDSNAHIGGGTTEAAWCQFDENKTTFLSQKMREQERGDFPQLSGSCRIECDWLVAHINDRQFDQELVNLSEKESSKGAFLFRCHVMSSFPDGYGK